MDTNQTTVKTTTDTLNQDNSNPTNTANSNASTVNNSTASNNTASNASANTANNVSTSTTSNNASANAVSAANITSNTCKPENEHEGKAILWAFIANMAIFLIKFIVATITKSASMIESSGANPDYSEAVVSHYYLFSHFLPSPAIV